MNSVGSTSALTKTGCELVTQVSPMCTEVEKSLVWALSLPLIPLSPGGGVRVPSCCSQGRCRHPCVGEPPGRVWSCS